MVTLYDLIMNEIDLRGVRWLELTPESPKSNRLSEKVWNGEITLGRSREPRILRGRFQFTSDDYIDYDVIRDEIHGLLDPLDTFYTVKDTTPGKRWKVEVEDFEVERWSGRVGEVAVTFYCSSGLAESIHTTLDPLTFKGVYFKRGMNIEGVNESDYTHNATTFNIFNAGKIVDPTEHELTITLTSNTATSTDLLIKNLTNGSEWSYTGNYNAGDTITIERVKNERNGLNIVHDTNLNLIHLSPDINEFEITGLSGTFEISFDFRYLYL